MMDVDFEERFILRAVCGKQFKDIKMVEDLMHIFGLVEAVDQLAMTNRVHWSGRELRREGGHVLRREFEFIVEGQRRHWGFKR